MLELDQTYLDWYFRILSLFGMWKPCNTSVKKSQFYTCYAVALFCLAGMTPSSGQLIHAWRSKNDIVEFTQHFTMVTAMVSTMAKIINLWRCRADIEMAIDLLNWERRQPCNRKFGNFYLGLITEEKSSSNQSISFFLKAMYRDGIITSTIRDCRLFSLSFMVMVFWYCSFSYGKDFIYHKGNMNKLSISPFLPLHSNQSSPYWIYFVIDKAAISYVAGCTACHDSIFLVFLMHAGAQLELLKKRLETSHDKFGESQNNDSAEKNDGLYDLEIQCVCRTTFEEMLLNPIIELHTCVKHHLKILRYVSIIQSVFNLTLLLQFVTSLLIITMAGFQIINARQLSSNELIDIMNFLMCALSQLFLYCWFGTDIIAKSEGISLSAYKSKWYIADERFKKTLTILLLRGQIPIVFKAGAICELSSDTFMNIISKCYSSMALLKRVNE